jgi:hypothetical protein
VSENTIDARYVEDQELTWANLVCAEYALENWRIGEKYPALLNQAGRQSKGGIRYGHE